MRTEKNAGQHPVKFVYTAELRGEKALSKLLGEEFSFFNSISIVSEEFDAEHEAIAQMKNILTLHKNNSESELPIKMEESRNQIFYEGIADEGRDWGELVAREVVLLGGCCHEKEEFGSCRLHVIPQLPSFEVSKLNPTKVH